MEFVKVLRFAYVAYGTPRRSLQPPFKTKWFSVMLFNVGVDKNNNFVIPLKYGSSSEEFFEGIACVEVIENNNSFYKYIFPNDKDAF